MDAGQVVVTRTAPRDRQAASAPAVPAFVALSAGALRTLDPERRSAAAAWAGVPESALEHLSSRDLPLVFEAGHPRAMRARVAEIARESGLPVQFARRAGCAPLVTGLLTLPLVPVLAALAWIVDFPPLLASALVLVTILAVIGAWGFLAQRSDAALREGCAELIRRMGVEPPPELVHTRARIMELRRALSTAHLPSVVAADLRGALRQVEDEVEALGARAGLADRIAAERAKGELVSMDGALTEVALTIDQIAAGVGDGERSGAAVEALVKRARLARQVLEAGSDGGSPRL
jgi:hypothetical protein